MNILNIGSDKTLVGGEGVGDAVARHRHYGEYVERLDIIVYARKTEKLEVFKIADNVHGYPSNSSSKLTFFFDAIKIFKKIYSEHKVDLIVCQDPFLFGLTGLWLKRRYGVKVIMNFHGDHWDNPYWLKERPFLNRLFYLVSKYTVPRADGVRVVSRYIKEKLVKRGIAENRVCVIATPVDLEKFKVYSPADAERIKSEYRRQRIILYVGRLWPIKNLPLLIRAFASVKNKYHDTVLLLAGAGPEKEKLEKMIMNAGINESVEFLGPVSPGKLVSYYRASDIFVLPSLSEGRPKVLAEAAAAGLPIVATNFPGADEIVKEGENGFLVPISDAEALAEKLLKLLKDKELRRMMGEKSAALAAGLAVDTTPELAQFWQEVISPPRGVPAGRGV